MQHIREAVCRLARDRGLDLYPSKQISRKMEAIELVRQHRDGHTHELAYNARPFVLCGLPIRRPTKGSLKHTRRNGRFVLEVIGHPDYGLPFGQDRLIPLWVASLAVRLKSRMILFDSAAEILREFGLPLDGPHYRRLVAAFQRIFGSTIYFGTESVVGRNQVWDYRRFHFFDRLKVWYSPETAGESVAGTGSHNVIVLSDSFWQEIQAHPIPVDLNVVRGLAHNPGCLDFYMWLTWRCFNAKRQELVPLFGPFGLASQLGVEEYSRDRNFRKRVRSWLGTVKLYWPHCPATLSDSGASLTVRSGFSIAN